MIDRSDEVKRALDYLSSFKEEMTSDKKHYTEVLIKEVKRLREGIKFALSYTRPTPHTDDSWMECREFIVEYLKELIE